MFGTSGQLQPSIENPTAQVCMYTSQAICVTPGHHKKRETIKDRKSDKLRKENKL